MKRRGTGTRKPKSRRTAPRRASRGARTRTPPRRAGPTRPGARGGERRAPARARRRPARRKAAGSLVQAVDADRQLADPVEAAQEDLRALPERALFDRDDPGRDDDLAEMLGEEFVRSVTSGEEQGVELRDEAVPEEEGGPFVETSASREFGHDADDSEVEPLPTTRAPVTKNVR
jgi:hypothetical protein